jgi:hypothetical protein
MSRNISKSRKSVNRISYCKVCHDAGKTEKEYRSHSTKDEKNNIICPTLLSLECRYCYKAGHTIKYCPSNKSKHKYEKKIEAREEYNKNKNNIKVDKKWSITSNKFANLCYDSDDNKKDYLPQISVSIKKNVDFPEINVSMKKKEIKVPLSYANIIVKTKEQLASEEKERINKLYKEKLDKDEKLKDEKIARYTIARPIRRNIMSANISWADVESSDDDNDVNYNSHYHTLDDDNW